jgi:hypothetical protein
VSPDDEVDIPSLSKGVPVPPLPIRRPSKSSSGIRSKIAFAPEFVEAINEDAVGMRDAHDREIELSFRATRAAARTHIDRPNSLCDVAPLKGMAASWRKRRPRLCTAWHLDEVYLRSTAECSISGAPSTPRAKSVTF